MPLHSTVPQEILKQVRSIEIRTRRLVDEIFAGQYSSVFKGRGMTFSQVREYQPGDDPKLIDWNVTARTGHLFTKEFMEERELTVMIVIDASKSLFFGSRSSLKSEVAAEVAALLSFSAIRNGDKVGLLIFTDRVEKFVPPRKGQRAILRLIREILTFHPQGDSTDLGAGMEYLARVLKRRAVCFLMSDFLSDADFEKPLRILAKKHDLVAVRITDALERAFPAEGRFLLRDLETGRPGVLDLREAETVRKEQEALFLKRKRMIERNRVDLIELSTGIPYMSQLLGFFKNRARRYR